MFIGLYTQKASKNEMFKQYRVSRNEIHKEDFLKVAVLNRSAKGVKFSSFPRAPCS